MDAVRHSSHSPGRYAPNVITRHERARRTREALIEAGLELAETTPLAGMSVNRVVEQAHVAKGSFFYHFGDRAGYLLALHRGFHDGVLADVRLATGGQPPGADRLATVAAGYLDACLRRRGVRALLLEARAQPAVAGEIRVRSDQIARLCEPDFRAMGRAHPLESARLWVGLVAEAALIEHDAGARLPDLRAALREYLR